MQKITEPFLQYAADTLGDTNKGYSGSQIVKTFNQYAVDFNVIIPINEYPWGDFGKIVPNKRTAIKRNLDAFNSTQQYIIIKEMCNNPYYSENQEFIKLNNKLKEQYSEAFECSLLIDSYEETGWKKIDDSIKHMKEMLKDTRSVDQINAIAVIGRQTEILIAREVYNSTKHGLYDSDGTEIGNSDVKRMLNAYISYELKNDSEKVIKWVKASFDLCNQITHSFSATKRNAMLCISAVKSLAEMIKCLKESELEEK